MPAILEKKYTLEEYLNLDKHSEERLEYWQGEIFNMSGVSPEHDEIESNSLYFLRRKLVAQHRPHITQLLKNADGDWIYREFNDLDAILRLQSLDCEIALRGVYQNVSFEPLEIAE